MYNQIFLYTLSRMCGYPLTEARNRIVTVASERSINQLHCLKEQGRLTRLRGYNDNMLGYSYECRVVLIDREA